jgi:hypothetical protein
MFAACIGFFNFMLPGTSPQDAVQVTLVRDHAGSLPIDHGWGKVKAALEVKGIRYEEVFDLNEAHGSVVVVAGLSSGHNAVATLVQSMHLTVPSVPESLAIHKAQVKDKTVVLLTGADERGAMYALLGTAERIAWAANVNTPLSEVHDTDESPAVADRGVTLFTMQQAQFEDRLHDERYWTRYLDMLSQDRFNRIQILFAYETDGYMCPAYPYFVDVKYPNVRVAGLSDEQRERNLADLHRLIRMAHDRGISVTLGLWCHYYRFDRTWNAIDHSKPVDGKVFGLSEADLVPYTRVAMAKFLRSLPDIDSIQFLMNRETGTQAEDIKDFWKTICEVMKESAPHLQYEVRAKGVSDDLIAYARNLGLNVRLNTKFWAEQMGLPFPPTHVQEVNQFERRHGYSDMLKFPREYDLHWTLWTSGTTRILLWGDPEYARRFAKTTRLGGSRGFEVDEPLATKMAGALHDMKPFKLLGEQYRYYDYEFERYWHFFQVFGRLSYNPDTPSEEWDREFQKRFGKAAPYVEQGLHRASQILPRITAYCLPANRFPTTRGWAERQREEEATPSDTEQFEDLKDAANDVIAGSLSPRITPMQTSEWFERASEDVLKLAAEAERNAGPAPNKELVSTLVDLRILANLAAYHSHRIPAGLSLALFQRTRDLNALDDAILYEKLAIASWEKIVDAAGDVYNFNLQMGLPEFDMSGHWKDELLKLNSGLVSLEKERADYHVDAVRQVGRYDLGTGPILAGYKRVSTEGTSTDFEKGGSNVFVLRVPDGCYRVDVGIKDNKKSHGPMWIETNGVQYSDVFTVPAGQQVHKVLETSSVDGRLKIVFDSSTSADWIASTLAVDRVDPVILHVPVRRLVPGKDFEVRATVVGVNPITSVRVYYGNVRRGYKSSTLEPAGDKLYRAKIPASQLTDDISYFLEATDASGRVATFRGGSGVNAIELSGTKDHEPPLLEHTPVQNAESFRPLHIVARVSDTSGLLWVRLRYRGLSQHQDFHLLEMLPTGKDNIYEATIPASDVDPHFDLMYLFEVMDKAGNGKIYPDLEKETPYIVVKVDHSSLTSDESYHPGVAPNSSRVNLDRGRKQ